MTVTFAPEMLRNVWQEIEELLPLHFDETGRREGRLDMDWDTYFALEEMGIVHVLVARSEGRMVGYFVGFIRPNLHNRQRMAAVSDMYFIHPDFRGHSGFTMFREVEKYWRGRGVQMAAITCKVTRRFHRLFERLGWRLEEHVLIKELE